MKSISKFIFVLLFIGIFLKALKMLYAQNNMEYITLEEVYDWYYKAGFYGNFLVSVAAVLSFICYKKYFPNYITLCYLLLLLLAITASLKDFVNIMKPSVFYSVKGIGTYINFGILFFVANTLYFRKIIKLFYFISFALIIAGLINLGKVGFGADRTEYLNAIRDFAVYLIWVFPFFLLQNEEDKKLNIANIFAFLIIFIFILSTGSRSYLAIYAIYIFAKFKDQLQAKNSILVILSTVILIVGAFFLFSNSGLSKVFEGAVNNLTERASEDSRSEQLVEFFSQYNSDYLLQGVGPLGRWNWSHWPEPYYYLDNQFILLGWWAGLPTLLVYIFFLIKPITQRAQRFYFENINGAKLILILWVLACAGFAIYVGISSDSYYDFITLLIGLQTCNFTLLRHADEDET